MFPIEPELITETDSIDCFKGLKNGVPGIPPVDLSCYSVIYC